MLVEGYDNLNDNNPLIDCAHNCQQNLGLKPDKLNIRSYQLTFSSTKSRQSYLRNSFNTIYKETMKIDNIKPHTYQHVLIATQAFLQQLEDSKLYSQIRLIISPSLKNHPHGIKLHFDIQDKSPLFLSASNEYDSQGAQIKLKVGSKNFTGQHDTLSFEYDKTYNDKRSSNWSINWSFTDLFERNYSFGFRQVNMSSQSPQVDEHSSEFYCSYKQNKTTFSLTNAFRSNYINEDDSLQGHYLFRRYIHNFDFIPSFCTTLNYSNSFGVTLRKNEDGIFEGKQNTINASIGIPKLTSNPFIKIWMNHQKSYPLYKHKSIFKPMKQIIANSALDCSLNYGIAIGKPRLQINDSFQSLNFRGINQYTTINQEFNRKIDIFGKLDFKFNVYNLESLKERNINLFYYTSFLTIGTPSTLLNNFRSSMGIGIAMPLGIVNLEALVPLYTYKKQFDKEAMFQIRIATDD